jgi:hypothetical protein
MAMTEIQFILTQPTTRQDFWNFCKSAFVGENVACWLECMRYRADPSKTKAMAIINKFVADGGADQVNLPGSGPAQRLKAELLATGAAYQSQQQAASAMNFFTRHWTAGSRKADRAVFDRLVAELESMMTGLLARFFETPKGAAAHAQFERASEVMPDNPAAYVALEQMGLA